MTYDVLGHAGPGDDDQGEPEPDVAPVVHLATRRPREGDYRRFLLPDELWKESDPLAHIYDAAKARNISPDAVLTCVLAHLAASLVRGSEINTGRGVSPLNMFVALIGASGTGKTQAAICAEDLLGDYLAAARHHLGSHGLINAAIGTGEGMIQAFMGKRPRDPDQPRGADVDTQMQVRYNAFFHADEGRSALAIGSRSGATLFGTLCSLWSGQAVGQTNASADRNRHLDRDSYSIGVMLGFQPTTVADLFADDNGGTPQRFLFASASYPPWANLDLDDIAEWPGRLCVEYRPAPTLFTLGEDQQREIRARARARHSPDFDDKPLDAHQDLIRARVAALVALLHGTKQAGAKSWELAGVICRHSAALRNHVAGVTERRRKAEIEARKAEAVEVGAALQDRAREVDAVDRARATIVAAVERAGSAGLTAGKARNAARRYPREVQHAALEAALKGGQLVAVDDLVTVPS
jgi:hypothetical protein